MKILKIYPGQVDERHISEAARTLRDGGVVIFPTDTIYALGCDAPVAYTHLTLPTIA